MYMPPMPPCDFSSIVLFAAAFNTYDTCEHSQPIYM